VESDPPPRSRLRELRNERGWTQQEVAERLARLAWTRSSDAHVGVTGDMVAKWERGKKRPSPRYRNLLAALYRVGLDELEAAPTPGQFVLRGESMAAMLDDAAELLDRLGSAGRALRPHVFEALTDDVLTRRSVLAMLDQTPLPARSTPQGSAADLEALAEQCEAAYPSAPPAALLTAVAAQLRIAEPAELSAGARQRYLRARARLAILAGRLASSSEIGNVMAARAYLAQATDDAYEVADQTLAATAAGYMAQLAMRQHQRTAAIAHLRAAGRLDLTDPTISPWLTSLEATANADNGRYDAAGAELRSPDCDTLLPKHGIDNREVCRL